MITTPNPEKEYSVIYQPHLKWNVYVVEGDSEEAMKRFNAWMESGAEMQNHDSTQEGIEYIGSVAEEENDNVLLATEVEGTFPTYEDARESDEAMADG